MMHAGRLPSTGGEINMAVLAKTLDRDKYEPWALCRPGPMAAYMQENGVNAYPIMPFAPEQSSMVPYLQLSYLLDAMQTGECNGSPLTDVKPVIDALDALKYRMINPTWWQAGYALLAPEEGFHLADLPPDVPIPPASRNRLQALMIGRDALRIRRAVQAIKADICVFDAYWDAIAGALALQGTNVKCVWYVQMACDPPRQDRVINPRCQRIITCGRGVAQQRFAKVPRVSVAQNGADTSIYKPKEAGAPRHPLFSNVPEKDLIIGMVATIEHRKAQDILIEASGLLQPSHPNFQLYFFGQVFEDFKAVMMQKAEQFGVTDRIHLEGFRNDLPELIADFDISVLCSREEGLPLSLCEAMACGVPCVATRLPGIEEIAGNGSALLVPVNNGLALCQALQLLAESKDARKLLGQVGRNHIEANFTKKRMISEFDTALAQA